MKYINKVAKNINLQLRKNINYILSVRYPKKAQSDFSALVKLHANLENQS